MTVQKRDVPWSAQHAVVSLPQSANDTRIALRGPLFQTSVLRTRPILWPVSYHARYS